MLTRKYRKNIKKLYINMQGDSHKSRTGILF